jgi:plastocyanin
MNRRDFLRTAGGAAGGATAVAAGSGTAGAQEGGERPVWPSYVGDANDQGYEDLRGNEEVTVEVGSNFFAPTKVWVDPGTTIVWEFTAPGHNVKFNSQPDGAGLSGTPGGTFDIIDQGETYSVTADPGGMYDYFCGPHESQGMKGAIAVGGEVETESVGGGGGGGGGEPNPEHMGVPFHPHYVGVATIVMMVVSLLFAFFTLKYGESPNASGGNR